MKSLFYMGFDPLSPRMSAIIVKDSSFEEVQHFQMYYVHEFSEHSMIPGFSGYAIALLLIPQRVMNNCKNFEQPLSYMDVCSPSQTFIICSLLSL